MLYLQKIKLLISTVLDQVASKCTQFTFVHFSFMFVFQFEASVSGHTDNKYLFVGDV